MGSSMQARPYGILFDDEKHTYRDFGLRIKGINTDMPDVKTIKIEVPGADGYVDMTDYFGAKYENRKLTISCDLEDRSYERWTSFTSQIGNYLHGKKRKFILDWDSGYYYVGRCKCVFDKDNRVYSEIELVFDCEPYKYEFTASDEDWLWDPLDFETGVIREYGNLNVNGSLLLTAMGSPMPVIPKITVSSAMTVTFNGTVYNLKTGTNYFPDIEIRDGDNTMLFTGNGTVSVSYRGGSL